MRQGYDCGNWQTRAVPGGLRAEPRSPCRISAPPGAKPVSLWITAAKAGRYRPLSRKVGGLPGAPAGAHALAQPFCRQCKPRGWSAAVATVTIGEPGGYISSPLGG